jgi:hypothetical protein
MGAYLFTGLRFLLGALILLPFVWRRPGGKPQASQWPLPRDLPGIVLAGLLLFGGISFQQVGLRDTTASNGFHHRVVRGHNPFAPGNPGRQADTARIPCGLPAIGSRVVPLKWRSLILSPGCNLVLALCFGPSRHRIGRLVQRLDALHVALGQDLV